MRQVLNWVGGGFFRTIGRTLAFLALGALAYYLFSKSSFDIKDLFFEKVNASEIYTSSHWLTYYTDDTYNTTISGDNTDYQTITQNSATSSQYSATISDFYIQRFTFYQNGYITIPFNITYLNVSNITHNTVYGQDYCSRYQCTQWDSNNQCLRYTCDYVNNGQNSDIQDREYIKPNIIVSASIFTDNQYENHQCEIENNLIKCSINANSNPNFYKIRLTSYVYYSSNSYQYYLNLGRVMTFYTDRTTSAIENQTQQQHQDSQAQMEQSQQQHNEIMDTNSTETDETATSFFDSFEDTDHGGLSSIITAPLVVINEMLNGVCVQPSATWKGATISLPCGDLLWSRNGASDLKNLLNIFYGGVICYYAIRKLFMMIEGLKDPTQDRIEVTDL